MASVGYANSGFYGIVAEQWEQASKSGAFSVRNSNFQRLKVAVSQHADCQDVPQAFLPRPPKTEPAWPKRYPPKTWH